MAFPGCAKARLLLKLSNHVYDKSFLHRLCRVIYRLDHRRGNLLPKRKQMKNYVSAQTAWALKNAGFPQPKVKVGQVWYNDLDAPSIIVKNIGDEFKTGEHHYIGCSLHNGRLGNDFPGSTVQNLCAFAPTAEDILDLLPAYVLIKPGGKFLVYQTTLFGQKSYDHSVCSDESAAEACADKFLEIKGFV